MTVKFKLTIKYTRFAVSKTILNFHSLRYSSVSWLIQRGGSIYKVSKLLGHSDRKMTQIYAHQRTEKLSQAVNKL